MGRQIVYYCILWVANYQTLRTTGLQQRMMNFTFDRRKRWNYQNSGFQFHFFLVTRHSTWMREYCTLNGIFNAKKVLFISKWKFAKLNWFAAEYNSLFPKDLFCSILGEKPLKIEFFFNIHTVTCLGMFEIGNFLLV